MDYIILNKKKKIRKSVKNLTLPIGCSTNNKRGGVDQ
jgi:hypothetical protein